MRRNPPDLQSRQKGLYRRRKDENELASMSDIMERLRERANLPGPDATLHAASANEIEQLKAEIKLLRADLNDCNRERARWRKEAERVSVDIFELHKKITGHLFPPFASDKKPGR
jgi:hypothetical protein